MAINNMFWWPSFWGTGWSNQGLKTPTKQQKFPWLTDEQIKRLESITSDPQEQQKLYQQTIQQLNSQNFTENRIAAENELTYRSLNTKDTQQKNYMQSNVRLEQLADLTKKKFWLDADADTQGVINWLMQYAQDHWVSLDSMNDYLAWYNDKFLYETGLKEETTLHKIWQTATDIVGWAYDSVTWLPKFLWKWAADIIGWTAKQFGADEQKTDALVQSYKDYLDNDMSSKSIWADQDSLAYWISKGVSDLTQVATWEWLMKWAVQWTVKWWQLLNYLKNAPTWQKMVAWWLEWAWDMTLYSIVSESKLPSKEELALWGGIWAVIPWAWAVYKATKPLIKKWTEKVAAKLELSWMLNPAKLNTIKNQLIEEWTDLASAWLKGWKAEDVGTWMIERWFKGDKETIINDLWEHAKKSHKLKREVLWASSELYEVDSAKKSLEAIHNVIKDTPWLEERLARVEELMWKDKYTLSELDEIKSILDDSMNLYTITWEPRAWAAKQGLVNVRKELRKYIEDAAEKEWLWNVKLLNNETQIAKSLEDAIWRKDNADKVRELLSVFDKWTIWWALGWWVVGWPFDSDTAMWKVWNIIVWALAWKYLFSTKAKTQLASYLNKLSGGSKKELERLVAWDLSVKKLSNKTQNELANLFEEVWLVESKPTELTEAEYQALLKKYSNSDLPALEFKEWIDNYNTIIGSDSERIIWTPSWQSVIEKDITEIPKQSKFSNEEIWSRFKDDKDSQDALKEFLNILPQYEQKWWNYTLERMLNKLPEYQTAKVEYDEFLKNMAKETGGTALTPPLKIAWNDGAINWKWAYRALQKAFWKSNWIEWVTDIVRWTTAAKNKAHMEEMLNWIKKNWIDTDPKFKFDDKFTTPTDLWYKDLSFIYTTKNWIKAEVQINTPNMLVAKEWKEAIKMWIIDEAAYDALIKKVWVEWGLWHKYYEQWRALDDAITNWSLKWAEKEAAIREKDRIAKESREYYAKFEE